MRSTSEDGKKTTFKITGLDAEDADGNELTYYVVETKVDGYNEPGYALDIGGTVTIKPDNDPTKNMAVNGNYIINTPEGKAIFDVYSHTGYAKAVDSDYDGARAALAFAK